MSFCCEGPCFTSMLALVSCHVSHQSSYAAVQRRRQRLLRCWKSQPWICRPLSGSPCTSTPRVSVFHKKEITKKRKDYAFRPQVDEKPSIVFSILYGLSIKNEPFVTCHPGAWLCAGRIHPCSLCCAYMFASSTRTRRTEHELLCCNIWPQQCLAL